MHRLKQSFKAITFIKCQLVNVNLLREWANGTGQSLCIVGVENEETMEEPTYFLMIQGQVAFETKELRQSLFVYFAFANILYLKSGEGKNDLSLLIAFVNRLCFDLQYEAMHGKTLQAYKTITTAFESHLQQIEVQELCRGKKKT